MIRWQYKVVHHRSIAVTGGPELADDPQKEKMLDRYGAEGWELTAVTSQTYRRESDPMSLQGYTSVSYFFKREQA